MPFRVEDVAPSATLEYFISETHWLDAFTPPLEHHLERLADAVKRLLASKFVQPRRRREAGAAIDGRREAGRRARRPIAPAAGQLPRNRRPAAQLPPPAVAARLLRRPPARRRGRSAEAGPSSSPLIARRSLCCWSRRRRFRLQGQAVPVGAGSGGGRRRRRRPLSQRPGRRAGLCPGDDLVPQGGRRGRPHGGEQRRRSLRQRARASAAIRSRRCCGTARRPIRAIAAAQNNLGGLYATAAAFRSTWRKR